MSPVSVADLLHARQGIGQAVGKGVREALMPSEPVVRAVAGGTAVVACWIIYSSVKKQLLLSRIEQSVAKLAEDE